MYIEQLDLTERVVSDRLYLYPIGELALVRA